MVDFVMMLAMLGGRITDYKPAKEGKEMSPRLLKATLDFAIAVGLPAFLFSGTEHHSSLYYVPVILSSLAMFFLGIQALRGKGT
jgi:hypothetical protein